MRVSANKELCKKVMQEFIPELWLAFKTPAQGCGGWRKARSDAIEVVRPQGPGGGLGGFFQQRSLMASWIQPPLLICTLVFQWFFWSVPLFWSVPPFFLDFLDLFFGCIDFDLRLGWYYGTTDQGFINKDKVQISFQNEDLYRSFVIFSWSMPCF